MIAAGCEGIFDGKAINHPPIGFGTIEAIGAF
jgi:hypothetical protein